MTISDLIKGAMRKLGAINTGETPTAAELQDGFEALNSMLDSWSLERLIVYEVVRTTKVLTAGTSTYTIGSGGAINIARPVKIERAGLLLSGQTIETPIEILTNKGYAEWPDKTTQNIPSAIYFDGSISGGLATITVLAPPNAADTLVLYPWTPITRFTSTAQTLTLPPGYERALRYGLAIELADEYGKAVSEVLASTYNNAKAAIKRVNLQPVEMEGDPALASYPSGAVDRVGFLSGR